MKQTQPTMSIYEAINKLRNQDYDIESIAMVAEALHDSLVTIKRIQMLSSIISPSYTKLKSDVDNINVRANDLLRRVK